MGEELVCAECKTSAAEFVCEDCYNEAMTKLRSRLAELEGQLMTQQKITELMHHFVNAPHAATCPHNRSAAGKPASNPLEDN